MSLTENILAENPKGNKMFIWAKLIAMTGGAQTIIQAIGFVSGIVIIRLLSTQEYAYYIIANGVLGTMNVLADGGIGSGVMSQGAKVWQDKDKLGSVVATGIFLRKRFSIFSLLFSLPILTYLLLNNGASWTTAILICIAIIPAFYAALWENVLTVVPSLHQALVPLQLNQMFVGFGRLVLAGLSLFIFPFSYLAIVANGIPRLIGNYKLKKLNSKFSNQHAKPDRMVRVEILRIVKRFMPGAIYFSVSGQITIWLISVFGNSTSVAQIGALGRFSLILAVINSLMMTLIVPRFARLPKIKKTLLIRYFQILMGLMVFMLMVVGLTILFPNQILWILGDSYKNLQFELVLCIMGACIGVSSDIAFSLLASRGWMYNPLVYIGVNILSIISCALMFDITTLIGALMMAIVTGCSLYIMNIIIFIYNNSKK